MINKSFAHKVNNQAKEEESLFDRRLHPRVKTRLPATLKTKHKYLMVEVTDVTSKGVALKVPNNSVKIGDLVEVQFEIDSNKFKVVATGIISSIQDNADSVSEIGIRFKNIESESRNRLSAWLAERLKDKTAVDDRRTRSQILSKRIEFRNRADAGIVGVIDIRENSALDGPWVIIPPAYGETKTGVLTTSYYLAMNGFNCLRYDATNHTGESDGEIMHWSLRSMANDLTAAIDYLTKEFGIRKVAVAAYSMAARAAAKAAAEDPRISTLITLVGVVDLQATLKKAYHEDLIGTYLQGKRWGITEVVGFQVDLSSIEAAISGSFHSLQTTIDDLKRTKANVVQIVTEHDLWVSLEDVQKTAREAGTKLEIITGAFHQLSESPTVAKLVMRTLVKKCLESEFGQQVSIDFVQEPTLREIALQSRVEKERMRNLSASFKDKEEEFWEKYLSSFDFILRSKDYQQLFEIALKWVPTVANLRVLDAGCGTGNFIAWLLSKHHESATASESMRQLRSGNFEYVGLDYVQNALQKAKARILKLLENMPLASKTFRYSFVRGDLNKNLAFHDNYFNFSCGNMVLSYVDDALFTLREFYRILSPGGRLLLTSLKPSPDLGVIFNEFAKDASPEDLEKARELLNNAGGIRYRVNQGYFRFFSAGELKHLMHYAGFENVQTMPVILNQGVMVVGEKK